jgi:hypothetical protein
LILSLGSLEEIKSVPTPMRRFQLTRDAHGPSLTSEEPQLRSGCGSRLWTRRVMRYSEGPEVEGSIWQVPPQSKASTMIRIYADLRAWTKMAGKLLNARGLFREIERHAPCIAVGGMKG